MSSKLSDAPFHVKSCPSNEEDQTICNHHINSSHINLKFLFVGSGRLATHLKYYFENLGIPIKTWSRNKDHQKKDSQQDLKSLAQLAKKASHIWILTKDDAVAEIAQACKESSAVKLHCSGSLIVPGVFGAHPLMTFGFELYPLDFYSRITFVLDTDTPSLKQISPLLLNPEVRLEVQHKALYHALCVVSGNLTVLLWQMAKQNFQELEIRWHHLQPYLERVFLNLSQQPDSALTGPFVRGDLDTINRNIQALTGKDFQEIYSLFWEIYQRRTHGLTHDFSKNETRGQKNLHGDLL